MNKDKLFFNRTTLCIPGKEKSILQPGAVLILTGDSVNGYQYAEHQTGLYLVDTNDGWVLDKDDVDVKLFQRAISLGYKHSHEYFAPGYNELIKQKLWRFEATCTFCWTADDAVEKAAEYDRKRYSQAAAFAEPSELERLEEWRDRYTNYAYALQQFENIVKGYTAEQMETAKNA